jgi:dTMP kinase
MSQKRGLFVVLEGIDHAGKTTQCDRLVRALEGRGKRVTRMAFPDRSTATGREISAYLSRKEEKDDKELHDLFCKNRWEKRDEIMSTLNSGGWIVCDRYAFSGTAYSMAKGMSTMDAVEGDRGLPSPDLVVFLDVDANETATRKGYGDERYDSVSFQARVYQAFHMVLMVHGGAVAFIRPAGSEQPQGDSPASQETLIAIVERAIMDSVVMALKNVHAKGYPPVETLWP